MRLILTAVGFVISVNASAQWTVVNLHPAGASSSWADGVSDGQQVGGAGVGGAAHAGLWSGSSVSWVDLHPAGAIDSYALDVSGGQQVGQAWVGGTYRASLWAGTHSSWVDLNPAGASTSGAWGVSSGQQVGNARFAGADHAILWSGSAASWVDLNPAGATRSSARGMSGGQQVGFADIGGVPHASLWTGTAASWVDLHPAGAIDSLAYGVGADQQVGYAWVGGTSHASLWSGTAGSWVDLYPAGATASRAFGVSGGQQAGYARFAAADRASLWSGTAGSRVDLHAFLPPEFSSSTASGISHEGDVTYVVGTGFNSTTNRDEALKWMSRSVAPASYSPVRGIVTGGNLASLLNSDNNRMVVRPGIVFATGEPPVQIRVDATAPAAFPNGIAFSVESSATFGNAQQKIWLWNYVIGDYELVDTRLATLTDDVTNVIVRTNSSRFIQPGTLAIRALVSYRAIGPAFAYPWSARMDKVWWTFPG